MFKMINAWIKRAIQKIKGKPEVEYDTYSIPNGPTFFVPKGTTPPGVNDNVSWKLPEKEVKADTDGNDVLVYSVNNELVPLGLDEDELKLTKEEIKEVDDKINNWHDNGLSKTPKDVAPKINKNKCHEELIKCVDEFKEKQKNLKRDKDISPIYDNTLPDADIPEDMVFNVVKGGNIKPKEEKRTTPKRRRRRPNNKKKSGEKK